MKVGWVFFIFSVVERLTGRGWAAAIYPAGGDPSPQRTKTYCTAQAAEQAVPDARQTTSRTDTHARTLDTLHRSATIQDRPRRADQDGGGRWRVGSASETVQIRTHTSRLALSHIFVMFCCMCNGFALYKVTQV